VTCERCGSCCEYLLFPIEPEEDLHEWVRLHGLEVVRDRFGLWYAKVETPCEALEGTICTIYERRPKMCADAGCLKEIL
jgi:Fe-S-cluster containining protein